MDVQIFNLEGQRSSLLDIKNPKKMTHAL